MSVTDAIATTTPGATETEFASEPCILLDREALATVSADPDMAIIRIKGKGPSAVYVGFTAERALRIGAAFIRAGLQVNPSLRAQLIEDNAAQLGVVLGKGST